MDTLYHAVARRWPETVLVTADRRYVRKAKDRDRICLLEELELADIAA